MTPRWLIVVAGLVAPMVHAQTQPVAASDSDATANMAADDDYDDEVDGQPLAPSAPPALPQETPSARPYAEAVWTSGHWYWDDTQWRYKPGAWVARMPGYQFVNGYWQQEGSSYRWVPGGWAQPGTTQVDYPTEVTDEEVAATEAPPALRQETPPPSPDSNYEWAPGYWYWSGSGWDWVAGNWVAPPRPGLVFVSPSWVHRGPSWYFVGGGWAARGSTHVFLPEYRHAAITVRWGHPNYFVHSWRRYPTVHHYWYGSRNSYRGSVHQSWGRPNYYSGPSHHSSGGSYSSGPRGPYRGGYSSPNRGGGSYSSPNRGGGSHGGGGGSHGGGGNSHGASPVGGGRRH